MKRFGFVTSGGDCQSLNATMRGVAKTLYEQYDDIEIYLLEIKSSKFEMVFCSPFSRFLTL